MSDTDGPEKVEYYILSSKYRSRALEQLAGTVRATPKEIADSVNVHRSHISRALAELREKDVVELRVPEGRTVGRYYGLTERGKKAWPEIKHQIRSVEWIIEDPSTPATCSVVKLARDKFGEELRCPNSVRLLLSPDEKFRGEEEGNEKPHLYENCCESQNTSRSSSGFRKGLSDSGQGSPNYRK
nr:winged helix-turn-helix domain-containing protein [Halostagnicola sp. A56]